MSSDFSWLLIYTEDTACPLAGSWCGSIICKGVLMKIRAERQNALARSSED